VLELEDGTFIHIVTPAETGNRDALTGSTAFKAFSSTVEDRQVAPSQRTWARVVGNYRMMAEPAMAEPA
jgi:hypothetical protein